MKKKFDLKHYVENSHKAFYLEEVNTLKNQNGEWVGNMEYVAKQIQYLNEKYDQDGSDVFNEEVKILKKKKYPKDVEEKIINEFKKIFLSEFYEEKKSLKSIEEEEKLNEYRKKIEKIKPYLEGIEHILDWSYSDFTKKELEVIGNTIASLPIYIQKELIEITNFNYFTNPSTEILTYALEKGYTTLNWLTPKQRSKEIDMIAAKAGRISGIKDIKNLSKEAILAFIENNPERIITDIDYKNWNTKDLTIYDLNKKELEAYKRGLENLQKRKEEKQIELIKKNPTEVFKMENPSDILLNYAETSFRKLLDNKRFTTHVQKER